MTMESVTEFTDRGKAIKELQQLIAATVAGSTALTNIAVTGIKLVDTLQSVIEIATTTGIPTDRTAETSITSDGNIQLSTTNTPRDKLIVQYWRKPSG